MELIAAPSKTDQIAAILRNEIRKGALAPGTRISKIRDLAARFQVSTRVVSLALEKLQSENLVRCEHGRGIFVSPVNQSDKIEVCLLMWGIRVPNSNFTEQILRITYPPVLRPDFNFTIRMVMNGSLEFQHFAAELARLKTNPNFQCLLANTSGMTVEQIKELTRQDFPVVFVGDSSNIGVAGLEINQVTGDNGLMGRRCVEFLAAQGEKEVNLLTMSRQSFFYEEFCREAQIAGARLNMKIHIDEIANCRGHSEIKGRERETYAPVIERIRRENRWHLPFLLTGAQTQYLLPENGDAMKPRACYQTYYGDNCLAPYYDAIFAAIRSVLEHPEVVRKYTFETPFELIDAISLRRWRWDLHQFIPIHSEIAN